MQIATSDQKIVLIDELDYAAIRGLKWRTTKIGRTLYAYTYINGKNVYMHRHITNAPKGIEVDHVDGDGLNNMRSNLRLCTHKQNLRNRRPTENDPSGYKGVSWRRERNKWRARIMVDGKDVFLGHYDLVILAALAYDDAARKYFGEFARTNFKCARKATA